MRLAKLMALVYLTATLSSGSTLATPDDYCAAYAVDFANAGQDDQAIWQQRFDNASKDCLLQYAAPAVSLKPVLKAKAIVKPIAVAAKIKKPAKPAVAAQVKDKLKVKAKATPAVIKGGDEKKVAVAAVKIDAEYKRPEPGTPAWLDYCTRKYTSFDAAKGTYLSKTGVERKCLVTNDFR